VSFLPTFTEPVILGTDTAVNSLPDGEGEGDGVGDGVGFGDGVGLGVGFGAAATATVCAEVLLTAVKPVLDPVTLKEMTLPLWASVNLSEDFMAPVSGFPSASHWYRSVNGFGRHMPAFAVNVCPTCTEPVIEGLGPLTRERPTDRTCCELAHPPADWAAPKPGLQCPALLNDPPVLSAT
jgi:hypothetical protein